MKNSASDLRCARCRTISQQSWGSTLDGSLSVLAKLSSQVRSSDEGVPLTHGRGVCGSGNRSHSHPAHVPARCGQARPLDTGPLRLLRTTPVTCGITIPSRIYLRWFPLKIKPSAPGGCLPAVAFSPFGPGGSAVRLALPGGGGGGGGWSSACVAWVVRAGDCLKGGLELVL
jgi:hypothetical protein